MTRLGPCAPADTGNDPNRSLQAPEEKVTCGTQTEVNDESVRKWVEVQSCSLCAFSMRGHAPGCGMAAECWFRSKLAPELNSVTYSQLQSLHPNSLRALISAEGWTLSFQWSWPWVKWSSYFTPTPPCVCSFCFDRVFFTCSYWCSSAVPLVCKLRLTSHHVI